MKPPAKPLPRRAFLALIALAACGGPPRAVPQPPTPTPAPADPQPAPPVTPPAPQPAATTANRPGPLHNRLPNGLNVLVYPGHDPREHAEIAFGFLGGHAAARAGTADLAAETLVGLGDSSAGRPALRQRLIDLGGGSSVQLGPSSLWLSLRVPQAALRPALMALRAALDAGPTAGRAPLERLRDELVARRIAELWVLPIEGIVGRLLLGDPSPAEHLRDLQDRDPTDVVLYLARLCRPDGAVLAIRGAADAAGLGRAAVETLGTWQPGPPPPAGPPAATPARPKGIYWAAAPAPRCRAGLILPLPHPRDPHAVALQMLLDCLTMDGIGGRLERMLADARVAALPLRATTADRVEQAALVLQFEGTPDEVGRVWRAAQKARQSLRDVPPNESELRLALQRSRLSMFRRDDGDGGLRAIASRALAGEHLAERLRALAAAPPAGSAALRDATDAFLAEPMALVVLGGVPPADLAAEVTAIDLLPDSVLRQMQGGPVADHAAADAAIAAAVEAVGGRQRLERLQGYRGAARLRTDSGEASMEIDWHQPDRLTRKTTVLRGTVIATLDGGKASETEGDQTRPLNPAQAAFLRREAARHPTLLLAAALRGELRFAFVAVRRVQDRDVAILEAVGGGFDRLRLQIDQESHLVRAVECWEATPDGLPRHLLESWSDYRRAGGLRLPFRMERIVDDGVSRVEATWTVCEPVATR